MSRTRAEERVERHTCDRGGGTDGTERVAPSVEGVRHGIGIGIGWFASAVVAVVALLRAAALRRRMNRAFVGSDEFVFRGSGF